VPAEAVKAGFSESPGKQFSEAIASRCAGWSGAAGRKNQLMELMCTACSKPGFLRPGQQVFGSLNRRWRDPIPSHFIERLGLQEGGQGVR